MHSLFFVSDAKNVPEGICFVSVSCPKCHCDACFICMCLPPGVAFYIFLSVKRVASRTHARAVHVIVLEESIQVETGY